jgi:hypothetical protein
MSEHEVRTIGRRARERVLEHHTADRRAIEFENIVSRLAGDRVRTSAAAAV